MASISSNQEAVEAAEKRLVAAEAALKSATELAETLRKSAAQAEEHREASRRGFQEARGSFLDAFVKLEAAEEGGRCGAGVASESYDEESEDEETEDEETEDEGERPMKKPRAEQRPNLEDVVEIVVDGANIPEVNGTYKLVPLHLRHYKRLHHGRQIMACYMKDLDEWIHWIETVQPQDHNENEKKFLKYVIHWEVEDTEYGYDGYWVIGCREQRNAPPKRARIALGRGGDFYRSTKTVTMYDAPPRDSWEPEEDICPYHRAPVTPPKITWVRRNQKHEDADKIKVKEEFFNADTDDEDQRPQKDEKEEKKAEQRPRIGNVPEILVEGAGTPEVNGTYKLVPRRFRSDGFDNHSCYVKERDEWLRWLRKVADDETDRRFERHEIWWDSSAGNWIIGVNEEDPSDGDTSHEYYRTPEGWQGMGHYAPPKRGWELTDPLSYSNRRGTDPPPMITWVQRGKS